MAEKLKKNYYLYFVAFSVNIMSFTTGLLFAWTSSVIPKLNGSVDPENNPLIEKLTPSQESWITGLLSLGAAIGCLIFGYLSDKIGRKNVFIIYVVLVLICLIIKAFAKDVFFFYIARLIGGFGSGAGYAVLPIYIGEIAEDRNRGALGCLLLLFATLGILFAYCLGPFVTIMWFSLSGIIPLFIFLIILLVFVPESPYYLITKNRADQAEKSLALLRKNLSLSVVNEELAGISHNIRESFSEKQQLFGIFKIIGLRRGIRITLFLMLFQQFSGLSVLLMNLQGIFQASGSSLSSEIAAVIVGMVQLVASCITPIFIDKLGRRVLLLISTLGTGAMQCVIGIYFYLKYSHYNVDEISWLPLLCLVLFMILLNLGLGPIPYVFIGELFPPNTRAIASTLSTFTNLILSFITSLVFPYIVYYIGIAESIWLFAGFCVLGFVFVCVYVPETKGKSLHDIQCMLNS